MRYNAITKDKVENCVKKLKDKKASGPDNSNNNKTEFYKALAQSDICIDSLRKALNNEIENGAKYNEQKLSTAKMIPKTSIPASEDLRPLALTNISYKLIMSLIGQEMDEHIIYNGKNKQAGFSKGKRMEDTILILKYCIEK